MRAFINATVLFLIFAVGCFGTRNGSDGDSDGGMKSISGSGKWDSGDTYWESAGGSSGMLDVRRYPICGNSVREDGEICDGADLAGASCESLYGQSGQLTCSADCLNYVATMCYDHSPPPPSFDGRFCGNNAIEVGEICDGADLAGASCESLYGRRGTLRCTPDCLNFDGTMCFDPPYTIEAGWPDDDDAGADDVRVPVTGGCARSTGARCQSDRDCIQGGCSGELCYNPAYGEIATTCDCTAPSRYGCGCVNGRCAWWSVSESYGL